MKNKQAILIMIHNNLWTVEKLVKLLDYDYFDLFIHIDKKSDIEIEDIRKIKIEKSQMFIYKKIEVRWADVSQVECELFLIEKALKSDKYKYLHLISGADLPIKKIDEIFYFFDNASEEYIHFEDEASNFRLDSVNRYNIFTRYRRTSIVAKIINRLAVYLQKLFNINRNRDKDKIRGGLNWFSITHDLSCYILEKKEDILKNYKYTISGDELFLHTAVYNSKFKENLYKHYSQSTFVDAMRHVDWDRGHPYVFRITDFNELINSECMFARKFDEKIDKEIIEKLYETLKS